MSPDDDELQDVIDDAISDAEGRLTSAYLRDHLAKRGWLIRAAQVDVHANLLTAAKRVRARCQSMRFALDAAAALDDLDAAIARAEGR
jgi:hypothetical protein